MTTTLSNKVVVITGASSGIGKALVEEALILGYHVAACARNYEKLQQVFTETNKSKLLLFRADVSKEQDCKDFIDAVVGHWQTI